VLLDRQTEVDYGSELFHLTCGDDVVPVDYVLVDLQPRSSFVLEDRPEGLRYFSLGHFV
jgi:hypothetical protein